MKKLLPVLLAGVLFTACQSAKQVPYFQDITDNQTAIQTRMEPIRLRPEDKISILVNCKDPKLTNLFNLAYASRYLGSTTTEGTGSSQGVSCYTIDHSGDIDFPVVGKIHIAGLTRVEVAEKVKSVLESNQLVKDPIVIVEYANLMFTVMGEVQRPGRFSIGKDYFTILDAISIAGDLTIFGQRDRIKVIRKEKGGDTVYFVNMNSASDLVQSPVYYVKPDDVIYVEPNKMRARQTSVNGNTVLSASFWISVASLVSSVLTTVIVSLRK